jgi:hypothetical protein
MPGCEQCTSRANCTECLATDGWVLEGNECFCDLKHYSANGAQECRLCKSSMSGCENCTGSSSCDLCDTSGLWESSDGKCACKAGFLKQGDGETATCVDCKLTLQGCKNCSSSTVCDECDTTHQWELSGSTTTCKCANGFYVDGVNQDAQCINCATPNPGCTECTSATNCTKCDNITFWESDNSGKCKCKPPSYAVNSSGLTCHLCRHFITGCEECLSATNCTQCSAAQFWTLDAPICVCDQSHYPSSNGQTC